MPDRGTILVVDDVPANIELLVALLKAEFEIEVAAGGAEALELVEAVRPDLILLDVMMPTMDGFEVCTRLKARVGTADIPVILITARSDIEWEVRGLESGASDYVTKPMNPLILLARVRNHVALKKARDALAASALVDGLTGLANRRRFDEALALECGRLARRGQLLSLVLFDLDHLKALNDACGHLAGDQCLKKVGDIVRAALHRSADVAARYGGDEFACILPETDAKGALFVSEIIRQGVAALAVPNTGPRVTASLGVCTAVCHRGIAPTDLISAADAALYEAKLAGRNRIMHTETWARSWSRSPIYEVLPRRLMPLWFRRDRSNDGRTVRVVAVRAGGALMSIDDGDRSTTNNSPRQQPREISDDK